MVASATKASHPLVTTVHASPRLPAPTRIWTQNVLLRTPAPNHMPRSTSSGAEPHLGVPRRGECSLAGGPRPTAVRPAAAALLGKAPCPKGLGGGASLQGDASHATTLLDVGKSRRGTTVAEHTRRASARGPGCLASARSPCARRSGPCWRGRRTVRPRSRGRARTHSEVAQK
jgi:hypothetical protein